MKKLLCMFAIFAFATPQTKAQWISGSDIPEAIRAGQTASYSKNGDGYLFVVSGRNQDEVITPTTQRYQLSTNSWTNMAPHPTPLLGGATAIVKDTLYTIGGLLTTPGNAINTVRKYNIPTDTWSLAADFPIPIVDARAVAYQDSLIYVVGGYQHKTYLYNTKYDYWREATPILPPGSSLSWGGFAVHGDKLVYMCGSDGFLSTNYWNTVRVGTIDPNDRSVITWVDATPFPGETRTFFEAHTWKDGIIMTGGSTDNTFETFSDEVYFYNPHTDVWVQLPSKPTAWLTGNSGSVFMGNSSKLICASGFQTDYLYETEIFTQVGSLSIDNPADLCQINDFTVLTGKEPKLYFCTSNNGPVKITLTDAQGRAVAQLDDVTQSAGDHIISLTHLNLANGVYFCTLSQNGIFETKKILISN